MQAVGHKGIVQHLLDHRVAAIDDFDNGIIVHQLRAHPVERFGALGQGGQHIQFGHGGGAALQGMQVGGHFFQQCFVEALLQGQCLAGGRQRLVFKLFQFRGDKTLGIFQGLPALVIRRRLVRFPA